MSKGTGGLVERPTHAKRNAKRREETYGTFISSSSAQSRDPSFACSSRTTLEDVRDEDTALLAKDTVVKPPKPSSALEYLSPSLRLANIGSVARDHLASERTFLSYVRTSLAISMAGVVFGQMFLLSAKYAYEDPKQSIRMKHREFVRLLSILTILLGILVVLTGAIRYFFTQTTLVKGGFSPAKQSIVAISLSLLTITTFVLIVIIADAFGTL